MSTADRPNPVLLFDGACGFCRRAVLRFEAFAGGRVACRPYQEFDFSAVPPALTADACEDAVHLLEPDGHVTRGAEACLRAVACTPGKRWVGGVYRLPLVAPMLEAVYRLVAANRPRLSWWVRLLAGNDATPPGYGIGRRVFRVLLGIAFVAAFLSYGSQAMGLHGSGGVLPLERLVAWDAHVMPNALLEMPSVFWFSHGDGALILVHVVGIVAALAFAAGAWPRVTLALATLAWLSLAALAFPPAGPDYIGDVFLGYQWDGLLVEAGVLGLLVVPRGLWGRYHETVGGAGIWLLRLLLFRVVFGDVLVRWTSGDPGAIAPEALANHLWTQPMPTWIALLARDLPSSWLGFARGVDVVVGIGLVFGLFGPRRLRALAAIGITVVTLAGALTTSSGVWPLVVLALVALALDDVTWRRIVPATLVARLRPAEFRVPGGIVQGLRALLAVVLTALAVHVSVQFFGNRPTSTVQAALLPYQLCNAYGRFGTVEHERFALTIEGSADGNEWVAYVPFTAPGDPYRAPPGPRVHLDRVDWKLGAVAAAITRGETPPAWFTVLLQRLLDPDARTASGLFEPNAFSSAPPRALRVLVHRLEPASAAERESSGIWWYRRPGTAVGTPVMRGPNGQLVPATF